MFACRVRLEPKVIKVDNSRGNWSLIIPRHMDDHNKYNLQNKLYFVKVNNAVGILHGDQSTLTSETVSKNGTQIIRMVGLPKQWAGSVAIVRI